MIFYGILTSTKNMTKHNLLKFNFFIDLFMNINSGLDIHLIDKPTVKRAIFYKFVYSIYPINFFEGYNNSKSNSLSIFRIQ